jgi:purine-binding chemotaxis protein CheW
MKGKNLNQYVTFKIGKETYAINIEYVESIVSDKEIRPIPNTSDEVKGIANIQEDIVPIVDLRIKFALSSAHKDEVPFIIVCRVADLVVGLIVDSVNEVLTIEGEDIHLGAISPKTFGHASDFIYGVYKLLTAEEVDDEGKYELIIILNANKILGIDTLEEVERLKDQFNEGV